jgi:hypothetical protein
VTASISSGCVYAGRRAQIRTGDDTWRVGRSVTVADAVGVGPSRLHFRIEGVGAAGTFTAGPGPYVDRSVRCQRGGMAQARRRRNARRAGASRFTYVS